MNRLESQKTLAETIEIEKEALIREFPKAEAQITGYAEGIALVVNETLSASQGKNAKSDLDNLCAKLDFHERYSHSGLPPEILRLIAPIRIEVRKKILSGEIGFSKVPVKPKRGAGSIEEAVIMAETNE